MRDFSTIHSVPFGPPLPPVPLGDQLLGYGAQRQFALAQLDGGLSDDLLAVMGRGGATVGVTWPVGVGLIKLEREHHLPIVHRFQPTLRISLHMQARDVQLLGAPFRLPRRATSVLDLGAGEYQ